MTIKLPIQNKIDISDLQRVYSSCLRFAFNRFKEGLCIQDIVKEVKLKFKMNSYILFSCVCDARHIYHINETYILKIKTEIENCKDDRKIKRLKIKLKHLNHNIFGSRRNYIRYKLKKITKEEFKNNRLHPISVYDECKKFKDRVFDLDIINSNSIIFKSNIRNHEKNYIKIQLPKLRNNVKKQLHKLELLSDEKLMSYHIKLTNEYICIQFDETQLNQDILVNKDFKENRILGIDFNPNYIGYSILEFDKQNQFKIIFKEIILLKQLTKKSSIDKKTYHNNKRRFELIEIIKHLIKQSIIFKCNKISIEDLNIESLNSNCKEFNRLCNNVWNRTLLTENLRKRCNILKIELIEVNSAYSSFVGNLQNGNENTPDPVASSIEIARRGYKLYDKGWFYPIKKNIDNLKNLWKKDLDWSSLSWKELFSLSKESKLKYRFSLNESLKFLRFKTYKSNVLFYDFVC